MRKLLIILSVMQLCFIAVSSDIYIDLDLGDYFFSTNNRLPSKKIEGIEEYINQPILVIKNNTKLTINSKLTFEISGEKITVCNPLLKAYGQLGILGNDLSELFSQSILIHNSEKVVYPIQFKEIKASIMFTSPDDHSFVLKTQCKLLQHICIGSSNNKVDFNVTVNSIDGLIMLLPQSDDFEMIVGVSKQQESPKHLSPIQKISQIQQNKGLLSYFRALLQ